RYRAFQVRHRDAAVHTQSFNLKKHWIVSRIRSITPEDSTWGNHAHRRSASLHGMNLDGCSLRAQRQSTCRVEGVLLGPRRMVLRNIQGVEIVKVSLDFAIVF